MKWLRPWTAYKPLPQSQGPAQRPPNSAESTTTTISNEEDPELAQEKDGLLSTSLSRISSSASSSTKNNTTSSSAQILALSFATTLTFLLLFLFAPRPWMQNERPPTLSYYNCGNSSADATAAGCRFDVLSYAWLHPACFDQELMYEFLGAGEWAWYEDGGEEEGKEEVLGLKEVAGGERERVWVSWGYYLKHCTYMWRKMHRSLLTSRALDGYAADYGHTAQCEMALLDRERTEDEKSVMMVVKYPSCPVLESVDIVMG